MKQQKWHMIRISTELRDILAKMGGYGDSMDSIIRKLLKEKESKK